MGVYIKGMKMPGRCGHCPCFHAENPIYCQAVKADKSKRIASPYGLPRPDWCPLGDVPPHGDLIDAHSLKIFFANLYDTGGAQADDKVFDLLGIYKWIDRFAETSTIIEAEG